MVLGWLAASLSVGAADSSTPPAFTDQLVVRLKPGALAAKVAGREQAFARELGSLASESLAYRRITGDGSAVLRLSGKRGRDQITALAHRLAAHPDVLEVLPDRLFFPALTPTDPQYAGQWALSAASGINAPAAWDITTGDPNLVIAIVDTGSLPHDDLAGRWVGGYDFVSLAERENDANPGRDADASDPGDWVTSTETTSGPLAQCPITESRWHGTAMAGVIAANANNGAGIAGINWSSKLLPVRVVGKCGGYESDIADGMRWAVGIAVPSVPTNTNVAKVLNVSLSASGACSVLLQSAINEVIAAGAPIVVAAGNNTLAASGYSPGNCTGVITVGAVDKNGGKPAYANFGSPIALSAPGGVGSAITDAVLTTLNEGTTTPAANYGYTAAINGTSIATAQVTGIVSLMLSLNPVLSPLFVKEILSNSAEGFRTNTTASGSQADCTTLLCGSGSANALNALNAAQAMANIAPLIDGGGATRFGLRTDGTLFGWGGSENIGISVGQFYVMTPVVISTLSGVTRISAGSQHALALRPEGKVLAWGTNDSGQLGDGTTNARSVPGLIPSLSGVIEVAASDSNNFFTSYSLALKGDGTVWAWGSNRDGNLGDGTTTNRLTPVPVTGIGNVIAIAAGRMSLALRSDGIVFQWGAGIGTSPVPVAGLVGITAIAAGANGQVALRNDGTVWTWSNTNVRVQVAGLSGITQVRAGSDFWLALKNDGTVWAWGSNYSGELGNGTVGGVNNTPAPVLGLSDVTAIGAGANHALAMRVDGSVWAWGGDSTLAAPVQGSGSGSSYLYLTFPPDFVPLVGEPPGSVRTSNSIRVTGIANGAALSITGGEYSIGCTAPFTLAAGAINDNDTVCVRLTVSVSCGATTTATLSIAGLPPRSFSVTTACDTTPNPFGFIPQRNVPVSTEVTSNAVAITGLTAPAPVSIAGGQYSIGCTGSYTAGVGAIANGQTVCIRQISSATNNTLTSATLTIGGVSGTFEVTTIAAPNAVIAPMIDGGGSYNSFGLRADGTLFGWGRTESIGDSVEVSNAVTPRAVSTLSGITRISSGGGYSLAVRPEGTVLAWGNNASGQLGDGTTNSRTVPGLVPGLSGVIEVAAHNIYNPAYSLALKSDGTVWAWGSNGNGNLGDGTTTNRFTPGPVTGLANVIAIEAGARSLALRSDGVVFQWGAGIGSRPVQVAGISNIAAIAAGNSGQIARRSDGTVWTWSTVDAPAQVAGLSGITHVRAGSGFWLALRNDGTVWTWGSNGSGQLGNGTVGGVGNMPAPVVGLSDITMIGAGDGHALAMRSDGRVWAWGWNGNGEVGNGIASNAEPFALPVLGGSTGSSYLYLTIANDFAPMAGEPSGSVRISNLIRVTGIANGTAISVVGGDYSIGCTAPFTSSSGVINNNDTVCVRLAASSSCGTTTTATLSIDRYPTRSFSITTVNCDTTDTTPDPFGFTPQGNVPLNAPITSNAVTVTGLSAPAPVSIAGGQYSIGCTDSFTTAEGTITNGQSVCIRLISSATNNTLTSATLTIGGVSGSIDVTTIAAPIVVIAPMIDVGGFASGLGLRADGTLFGWGQSRSIGAGAGAWDLNFLTPIVIGTLSGITRISSGLQHALAVRPEGRVLAWGTNDSGQLGDGTTIARAVPALIPGLSGVIEVAASDSVKPYSLALKGDGTVWAWGSNVDGNLGDGTTINRLTPVPVNGLGNVVAIAAGRASLALRGDGTVFQWGSAIGSIPVQVAGLSGITSIAAGRGTTLDPRSGGKLARRNDGTVWAWSSTESPVQVAGLSDIVQVRAGGGEIGAFWLALKSDGTVWAWGSNYTGELGNGAVGGPINTPAQVKGLSDVTSISAGDGYALAMRSDGSVWAWGSNGSGQLGNGTRGSVRSLAEPVLAPNSDATLDLLRPTKARTFAFAAAFGVQPGAVVASNPVVVAGLEVGQVASIEIVGGEYSVNGTAFSTATGTVSNGDSIVVRVASSAAYSTTTSATLTIGGLFGRSSSFYVRTRPDFSASLVVSMVAAGDSHTLLLTSDGIVYGTGYNGNGQLGNGSTLGLSSLRPVSGLGGVVSIASGAYHGLALRSDGTVAAWGSNAGGQLGHNSTNNSERYFVNVAGLDSVAHLAAGLYHSVAVRADGTVWAWGLNAEGQVGDGTLVSTRPAPVRVVGLSGVTSVTAGGRHTLALLAGGTVVAWGANESGQLGDGSTTQRNSPVAISGLTGVIAIAAGAAHSLALKSDGTVVAWGFNAFGQLGVGDKANRLVPTAVSSLGSGVGLIAAGANHSLAVKAGGALYAWGINANSQLGNGNYDDQVMPVLLATPTAVTSIAGGARHTAAIDDQRQLYIWGDNYFGQVGNRSGNYSPHSSTLNVLRGDSVISAGTTGTGSGVGTGSNSGSSVLAIDGQATGFDFGSRKSGATVQVTGNYHNASLTESITGVALGVSGGGFGLQSSDCPTTLAPDQSCSFAIAFSPTAVTSYNGELVVESSVVGSPERRSLYGLGVAPDAAAISFSTGGLDFPPVTVGSASAAARHEIKNTGNVALTVAAVTSTLADFVVAHDCVNVAPGASCNLSVTFRPTLAGTRVAYLSVGSNATGSPHGVTVFGTGATTIGSPVGEVLTVAKPGAGAGTVTSSPAGISCGLTCWAGFPTGTSVTLTATPAVGSTFSGWGGACTGTGTCQVTMDAAKSVSATFAGSSNPPRLVNISTRGPVLGGARVLIGGFVISGAAKRVLIVARGPTVIADDIAPSQRLANPRVALVGANLPGGVPFISNDNWQDAANASDIAATGRQPTNAFESAILLELQPGNYTAVVDSGTPNATGIGIVEVYEVDNPGAPLVNISTRGSVLGGASVLIGGFVISGAAKRVLVVARGPTVIADDIAPSQRLANPRVALVGANLPGGVPFISNDNWEQAANAAEITATGRAPSNPFESAILIELQPGNYTAVVDSGTPGATGIGIIEVYAQ